MPPGPLSIMEKENDSGKPNWSFPGMFCDLFHTSLFQSFSLSLSENTYISAWRGPRDKVKTKNYQNLIPRQIWLGSDPLPNLLTPWRACTHSYPACLGRCAGPWYWNSKFQTDLICSSSGQSMSVKKKNIESFLSVHARMHLACTGHCSALWHRNSIISTDPVYPM